MTENTVMVTLTARYNSYKCAKECEHLNYVMWLPRCKHFKMALVNLQIGDRPANAVRCGECIELFGGVEDGTGN